MPVFWCVVLSLFPLMSRAVSGGVFWGVFELSMTLGSLCVNGWVCVPVLFVVWCEESSTGSFWPLSGARSCIQIEASVRVLTELSSESLIFPGAGNSLVAQCHGLGTPTPEPQAQLPVEEARRHKSLILAIKGIKKKTKLTKPQTNGKK